MILISTDDTAELCASAGGLNTQLQQTQVIQSMLDQCWASIVDGGPTLGRCLVFDYFFHA